MRTPDPQLGHAVFRDTRPARSRDGRLAARQPATGSRGSTLERASGGNRSNCNPITPALLQLPPFPGGLEAAGTDWAAKIVTR